MEPTSTGTTRRLSLKGTIVFAKNMASKARLVLNEGSSRSSKTRSIAQKFVTKLVSGKNWKGSMVRKTLPALKATALQDVIEVMVEQGIYSDDIHNKTEQTLEWEYDVLEPNGEIRHYKNVLEYFSVDNEQKVRGRSRADLWINEANELELEDFTQLAIRTTGQITLDYNPVDDFHWIGETLKRRKDYDFIHSTYLDNPFLEDAIIAEIEHLIEVDENYHRVFALGLKPLNHSRIFNHWKLVDEMPEDCDEYIYGIDFGFNHATAIVKIGIKDGVYYWEELFYETRFDNEMLKEELHRLCREGKITYSMQGYADAEDAARINELIRAGFNIDKADKEGGSVKQGILYIKGHKMFVTKGSTNLLDNLKNYMWKTRGGKILDEPVKQHDHALDAGRYAVYTHGAEEREGSFANIRVL